MRWQDLINGLFEASGGILLTINCLRLYRDKHIAGVSVVPTAFFMCWGYWNLYFYPSYNAWLSFAGGLLVTLANTVWVGQMIYYARKRLPLDTM